MFTLEDLKKDRKDIMEKVLQESGRQGVISFCSEVLDKRAYFTVDMYGNIKRKKYDYVIPMAVFTENDVDFINYTAESLDFTEKTKIEKIGRMTNSTLEDVKKNIFKLFTKGDFNFSLKACKELYHRDENEFFKMMYTYSMMDNISFEKSLAFYSLRKYFEKFGYSDEALYLTVSYVAKMRSDFSDYEKYQDENIEKDELRNIIKNDIDKFKTKKGLMILGYLLVLLSYNYEKENIFVSVLKNKIKEFESGLIKDEELSKKEEEIFIYLSKEV